MATETRILQHGAQVISEETDVETRVLQEGAQVIRQETSLATRVLQHGAQVVREETSLATRVLQFGAQLVYIPSTLVATALVGTRLMGVAGVFVALTAPALVGTRAIGSATFGIAVQSTSLVGNRGIGDGYVIDSNMLVGPSLVGTRAIGNPSVQIQVTAAALVRARAIGANALVIDESTLVAVSLVGTRRVGVVTIGAVGAQRTLRFRATSVEYGAPGIVIVKAVSEDPGLYTGYVATGGSPLPMFRGPSLAVPGSTRLVVFDSVLLRDDDAGIGYYIAVTGYNPGWQGCIVSKSADDGQTYEDIATIDQQSCIAYALAAPGSPPDVNTWDDTNTITVKLVRPDIFMLASDTEANVLNGTNAAAMIKLNGDVEIVQWTTATSLGSGKYQLTHLLRGRRGSEFAVDGHEIGEQFVALDAAALRRITATSLEIGQPQIFKATTLGTLIGNAVEVPFTL